MKTRLICIIVLASFTAMAQRDSLPYAAFPPAPDHYSAGTAVSRLIDGLGFRYYWATEGLRPIDLSFRPGPEARTSQETLEHIYSLSNMIIAVSGETKFHRASIKLLESCEKPPSKTLKKPVP